MLDISRYKWERIVDNYDLSLKKIAFQKASI